MPELPEVETVCRSLRQSLLGEEVADVTLNRADIRIPIPPDLPDRLRGLKLAKIERRAKYILFHMQAREVVLLHLGMSGRILVVDAKPNAYEKHDHVAFHFKSGRTAIFRDPRRFGLVTLCRAKVLAFHPLLAHLGAEPLNPAEFNAAYLQEALKKRTQAIKPALMDQRLVVGVGNIYASEALYCAGVNPERPANKVKLSEINEIIAAVRAVLADAIEAGGSSIRDYVDSKGEAGYFQHRFSVYNRAGKSCPACGQKILRTVQAGRATFWCPTCQKA